MDIVRLCLKMVGKRRFPRLILCTDRGVQWDGIGWLPPSHQGRGKLFADMKSVNDAAQLIQCLQHGEKAYHQVFRLPCTVDVYSDNPVPVEELRQWLKLALQHWLDYFAYGNGPNESGVVSTVEFPKLKQVRLRRNRRPVRETVDYTKSFVIDVNCESTTSWRR